MSDYEESPVCRRLKSTRLRRVFLDSSSSSNCTTPSPRPLTTVNGGNVERNESFLSETSLTSKSSRADDVRKREKSPSDEFHSANELLSEDGDLSTMHEEEIEEENELEDDSSKTRNSFLSEAEENCVQNVDVIMTSPRIVGSGDEKENSFVIPDTSFVTPRRGARSRSASRSRRRSVKIEVKHEVEEQKTWKEKESSSVPPQHQNLECRRELVAVSERAKGSRRLSFSSDSECSPVGQVPSVSKSGRGPRTPFVLPVPTTKGSSPDTEDEHKYKKFLSALRPPTMEEYDSDDGELKSSGSKGRRRGRKTESFIVPDDYVSEASSESEREEEGDEKDVRRVDDMFNSDSEQEDTDDSSESEREGASSRNEERERETRIPVKNGIPKEPLPLRKPSTKQVRGDGVSLADAFKQSFASPSVKKKSLDPTDHFLMSLSENYKGELHPEAYKFRQKGLKRAETRNALCEKLFRIFNEYCFRDKLPQDMEIAWNSRLRKTAGQCKNKLNGSQERSCTIDLSPKVCTTPERVRDTLVHELCHAAVWLVNGLPKHGHGPYWRQWTVRCMQRFQFMPIIERCHNYEIQCKYVYVCKNCGNTVKRHSASVDTTRKVCGKCRGKFSLHVHTSRGVRRVSLSTASTVPNGTTNRNKFADYVKQHYKEYKRPGVTHREVMKLIAERWKSESTKQESIPSAKSKDITDHGEQEEDKENDLPQEDHLKEGEDEDDDDSDEELAIEWGHTKKDTESLEKTAQMTDLDISTLSIH